MFRKLWKKLFPNHGDKQYTTVKYAFPLVVIATIFAGLASVVTENSSFVTIRTTVENVVKDEVFFIDVLVTAHIPVNALDLVIAYPKDKMKVEGIDTGTSVITLWTEEPYAKDGSIYLRGGTFRKGFVGEHLVARIRAHATEAGEARVFIKETQLVAGDGKGSTVTTTESDEYNEVTIEVAGSDGVIKGKAVIGIASDIDGDGDVDFHDISAFMSAWFTGRNSFDFNGDGKMTISDFSILLAESFFK